MAQVVLLALLAGCNGGKSGAAVDAGAGGPDGAAPGPARACPPIPAPPGEWQPVQARVPNSFGQFMPSGGEGLLVVDESFHRLLRSDDRGATWCFVPTPAPVLALYPVGERTLYMIPDDSVAPPSPSETLPPPLPLRPHLPPPSRVLRSDDDGDTWKDPGGMLPRQPAWVVPWSSDPLQMLAFLAAIPINGLAPAELWVTRDGGGHWDPVRPDGPAPGDPFDWSWVARHPGDGHTLVALAQALTDGITPDGIPTKIQADWLWTSTDEGLTWTRMTEHGPYQDALMRDDGTLLGLTRSGDVIAGGLDPGTWMTLSHLALLRSRFLDSGRGKIYVQGLRDTALGPISTLETSDGGRTWTTVSDDYVLRIPLSYWKGTSLELSGYGLRASDDAGKTWRTILLSTGFTSFSTGGGARFLTSSMALLRLGDEPGLLLGTPFLDRRLVSFLPHPTIADTAYAAMAGWVPGSTPAPMRTSDGGKSWQPFPITVEGKPVMKASVVAIAATTPPTLFATGSDSLVRSVDGGATWSRVMLSAAAVIRPAPSNPSLIYALVNGRWIEVSENGGLDWTPLGPDLFDGRELVIDPVDPKVLYVASRSRVTKSSDGGLTWKPAMVFTPDIPHPIALTTATPGTLFYVDARNGYVVETPDDGGTNRWHRPPGVVSGLAFDPMHPEMLYLTTDAGAFRWELK